MVQAVGWSMWGQIGWLVVEEVVGVGFVGVLWMTFVVGCKWLRRWFGFGGRDVCWVLTGECGWLLLQPLFPGESGVDQLVEIIKVGDTGRGDRAAASGYGFV